MYDFKDGREGVCMCLCLGLSGKKYLLPVSMTQSGLNPASIQGVFFSFLLFSYRQYYCRFDRTLSSSPTSNWVRGIPLELINPVPKNLFCHRDIQRPDMYSYVAASAQLCPKSDSFARCVLSPTDSTKLEHEGMHKTQQMEMSVWRSLIVVRYSGAPQAWLTELNMLPNDHGALTVALR